ncbi:MAG: hypothetical protein IJW92_01825 [Clostridia bacterium]|nr:hypothetical protein [Clostridia bacterium]
MKDEKQLDPAELQGDATPDTEESVSEVGAELTEFSVGTELDEASEIPEASDVAEIEIAEDASADSLPQEEPDEPEAETEEVTETAESADSVEYAEEVLPADESNIENANADVDTTTAGKQTVNLTEKNKSSNARGAVFVLKKVHLVIAAAVVLVLVVGGVVLGWVLGGGASGIDRNAVDYEWVAPGAAGSENGITLPGYSSVVLEAGKRKVGLILPNPSSNPCYFRYTLSLADTDRCFTNRI